MSLSIQQAAIDLLSKLGIVTTDPSTATALQQQDVIIAINSAGQWLQRAGEDFFTRTSIVLPLAAGTAQYQLNESIQAVIGPIRLNDQVPLAALRSRGELDQFDRIFLGQADYGSSPGTPIAYWVESVYADAGFQGDIASIRIWVAPIPSNNSNSLTIECIEEFPSFTTASLVSPASLALLPVAQNYAETIFMPIARYEIMKSSAFSRKDLADQITADYQRAMNELSTAGGFPDATETRGQNEGIGEREVNA